MTDSSVSIRRAGLPALATVVTVALIAATGYIRLVVYPHEIVPLTYALPLLLCLWHRDLRLHWAMAVCFLVICGAKWLWVLPGHELRGATRVVFASMQLANVLIPAVVLHAVVELMARLRHTVESLQAANAELEAGNEELAAREEEIHQQNEELQTQAEELEQQSEELATQTEELQLLNDQLAARERTLSDLVELSGAGATAAHTLQKLGESVGRLLAPRAIAAAVLEPVGTDMRVHPLFGLPPGVSTLKRERTLSELVVSRDRAAFLADTSLRPDLDLPRLPDGSRARSLLAAPLRAAPLGDAGGGAALEVYSAQPGEWSEAELRLLQWTAEQCGRTWANAKLNQDLLEQQELLRTVADNSSVGLFMINNLGVCTYANAAASQLTGYTAADLAVQPLHAILKADPVLADWSGPECSLARKNGERFTAACIASRVMKDGQAAGLIVEIRDITEQRRAAAEREQLLDSERAARNEAERAGRAKDEFVATLSHELRTPLNAVLGWATILRKNADNPPDLAKGLEVIERNARHQAQLISDLLDMSKITAGKIRLDVQPVDLPLVIEAALDSIRPAAEAKGVRLDRVLEPVDRMVTGDPNRLQQIVWNLLTNAVKFTPKGGSVQVALSRVASYVQVNVSDSGQGIDERVLPHLFERYRQGDASATRAQGGLGLGLAIVKHLVELHGGTVHARSEGPGRGACFTVLLPVRAVDPPQHLQGEPHPATPAALTLGTDAPTLEGLSILIVDDEGDARELVSRVLSDRGARVRAVASAEEALSTIGTEEFNLLVSDIGMPGMDGYTLIRRIRGDLSRGPGELPAIALTAFARSEDRTKALLAGFQSHISKPVEAAELIATVASVRPAVRGRGGAR